MTGAPLVSVVVIGRNEGARLTRCLQSVRAAHPIAGGIEIIFVDSGSTDDSVARAAALGATVLRIDSPQPSAARGRNAGWRAARGRYILFLDGDTVLHRHFLATALAAMAERVVAVWGHRREMATDRSVYVRVLDLDWIYAPGDTAFCGGDVLMRRAALEQTGGFSEALIAGEEPELCRRLRAAGGIIRHIDAPMTLHDLAIDTFHAYWRRAFRAGHAYAEVAAICRAGGDTLWSGESRRNYLHGLLVALFPVLAIAAALWHPALGGALLACAVTVLLRTAHRCRWKSPEYGMTRLLYALHSHFQQLPILCGQIAYHLDRALKRRRSLIEYRGSAS